MTADSICFYTVKIIDSCQIVKNLMKRIADNI